MKWEGEMLYRFLKIICWPILFLILPTRLKNRKNTGKKRKEVIAWLLKKSSDDTLSYVVNHAEIVRKLYNPKNKDEEDAYRSLFSRKLHQKDNGQGGVYTFSDKEINFIYSLMDNIL